MEAAAELKQREAKYTARLNGVLDVDTSRKSPIMQLRRTVLTYVYCFLLAGAAMGNKISIGSACGSAYTVFGEQYLNIRGRGDPTSASGFMQWSKRWERRWRDDGCISNIVAPRVTLLSDDMVREELVSFVRRALTLKSGKRVVRLTVETFRQHVCETYGTRLELMSMTGKKAAKRGVISRSTAGTWLRLLGFQVNKKLTRVSYCDGHERDDVRAYRKEYIEARLRYHDRTVKVHDEGGLLTREGHVFTPAEQTLLGCKLATDAETGVQERPLVVLFHDESTVRAPAFTSADVNHSMSGVCTLRSSTAATITQGSCGARRVHLRLASNRRAWEPL